MPHRAPPDEQLGDLRHGDGALHPRGRAEFFQRVLERERIDDRRQHPHVIARGAFDAALAARQPAKYIAAADHHHHLHAEFAHLADLHRHVVHRLGRDAHAIGVAERFAAQLEQDAGKFGFFGRSHNGESAPDIGRFLTARARRVKLPSWKNEQGQTNLGKLPCSGVCTATSADDLINTNASS